MNQMGPMKPRIQKIPPPWISAAGLLGPDLVLFNFALQIHRTATLHRDREENMRDKRVIQNIGLWPTDLWLQYKSREREAHRP